MKQFLFVLFTLLATASQGFAPSRQHQRWTALRAGDGEDPNEIIARRIKVKGAVQGGYYRSCVNNEVSRCLVTHVVLESFLLRSLLTDTYLTITFSSPLS